MKKVTTRASRRLFLITAFLATVLTLGLGFAPLSGISAVAAEHLAFKVGDIECISLSDGYFEGQPQTLAPEIPLSEIEAFLASCGAPTDLTITPLSCLFLRLPDSGLNVLVDTGVGPDFPVKTAGKMLTSLKEAGLRPEDIDCVLISHLHQDHVNGAFELDGRPVFPNATYYASKEEVDFWQNPATDLRGSLMPPELKESVLDNARDFLTFSSGKLRTFSAGEEVIPGVQSIPLPGHTPGQVGFLLQSRGESLFYIADAEANPLVSLQKPDWRMQNDENTVAAVEMRKSVIRLAMENHWNIFAPHFPWPGAGRLVDKAGKISFEPGVQAANVSKQAPINAVDLYNEFIKDQQEAQRGYVGKDLETTGIVVYTGLDSHRNPSVELSDSKGGKSYVLCVLDSPDQLVGVSVGDSVVISGNCRLFGSDDWVVIKQSKIIE